MGISNIVGYFMLNPLYVHIKYMICEHVLKIIFLNEPEFVCFFLLLFFSFCSHFQAFRSNMNDSVVN